MKTIRLIVVDDHALFRAGLISLLAEMPEFKVVGEAGDGAGVLDIVTAARPDVILMDVNMPGVGGIEAVSKLRKHGLAVRILMLTISKNDADLFGAIQAGADGYLLKSAEPEDLRRAILQISSGMSVLSPQVTRQVLNAINGEPLRPNDFDLSSREIEVLACLSQGKTTLQISGELFISENTVKTHVRHILEKLQASNRAEAVSKAIQLGVIKQPGN